MERIKPRIRSTIWNIKEDKAFSQNSKRKKEVQKNQGEP